MSAQQKPLRDWLYLAIVGFQLFGMLVLDLVPFYPRALWQPPSSPLHFLATLRTHHAAASGDPFFAAAGPARPWFDALLGLEGLVQLPLAAFATARLARGRATDGPAELAALAFGCLTAMGAVACVGELRGMGDGELAPGKRAGVYGMYVPYAVVPGVMAVDMYVRLLRRIRAAEGKAKTN